MANVVYNGFKYRAMRSEINLVSGAIKAALITDAYTEDADHEFFNQVCHALDQLFLLPELLQAHCN